MIRYSGHARAEKGDTAAPANGPRVRNVTRKARKEVGLWRASRCALTRGTRTAGLCAHMLVVVQLQGRWQTTGTGRSPRYREIIGNIRRTLTLASWFLGNEVHDILEHCRTLYAVIRIPKLRLQVWHCLMYNGA